MERKELGNNNRELWRDKNSGSRDNKVTGHNSVPTTGVLRIPDHWEGYECLLSDDLFTVLALDMWSHEDIDDELVKQHHDEISRFLNNLIRLRDGGISFHDQYPKLNLELAKNKVKEANARLETFRKRREYYKEVLEEMKRSGRERLERLIKTIIADNRVTVEESLQFIEEATTLHFSEAEAAGILLESILEQGFRPCKPYGDNCSKHYRLLSTDFERQPVHVNSNTPVSTGHEKELRRLLSVEELLRMGILEEYLNNGGKTEGKIWFEFYKSLIADFNIGDIKELESLMATIQIPNFKRFFTDMIRVEGGRFLLGAETKREGNSNHDDKLVHVVELSSYYIGKYPITQIEWEKVIGNNPSEFTGPHRPVECVSWFDVVEFCNRLSEKEGLQKAYSGRGDQITCDFDSNGYRLPTEAEWENAARGGKKSSELKYSGSNDLDEVGWFWDNASQETKEVGQKEPNELGIYDMSGNVWEWCWDWYDDEYFSSPFQKDPRGPNSGIGRVLRGGSWYVDALYCQTVYRKSDDPYSQVYSYGFRIAKTK